MTENLCLYWRFNEIQAGSVLDASGRNNSGKLSSASHVSPKPLLPNQPISDEDEWGEKVQLGHALEGEAVCENVEGMRSTICWTLELQLSRSVSVSDGSHAQLFSVFGVQVVLNTKGSVAIISAGSETDTGRRFPAQQWLHFALVSENGRLALFLSGSEVASGLAAPPTDIGCRLSVGRRICQTTEVRLWKEARTVGLIKEFMTSVIPQLARVSKWKGMRIKVESATSTIQRSFDPPAFASSSLFASKSRRVVEEKEPSPKSALLAQPTEGTVVEETRPQLVLPITHVEDRQEPLNTSALESRSAQASSPRAESPKTAPIQKPLGDKPGAELSTFDLWSFTPPPTPPELAELFSAAPELLPTSLPEATQRLDEMLEAAIVKPDLLRLDVRTLIRIIQSVSNLVRIKYRVGPYLSQMPPQDLLVRLRIACAYVGFCNTLKHTQKSRWGTLPALRLKLLPEHVLRLIKICISEAEQRNDKAAAAFLSKGLLIQFGSVIAEAEAEKLRMELSAPVATGNCLINCPFCTAPLKDPLQKTCEQGCKTRFSLCYLTGRLHPSDICARCRVCETVVSSAFGRPAHARGNIHVTTRANVAKQCPLCLCSGSLEPII